MVSADFSTPIPAQRDRQNRITAGDLFVVVAIGVITMALMVGLTAQLGVDVPVATAVTLASFLAMVGGHAGLRWAETRGNSRLGGIPSQRTGAPFEQRGKSAVKNSATPAKVSTD